MDLPPSSGSGAVLDNNATTGGGAGSGDDRHSRSNHMRNTQAVPPVVSAQPPTSLSSSPVPPSELHAQIASSPSPSPSQSNFWSSLTSRASGQRSRCAVHASGGGDGDGDGGSGGGECSRGESRLVQLDSNRVQHEVRNGSDRLDANKGQDKGKVKTKEKEAAAAAAAATKKSKPRSESIQIELDRIEMHERLLINGQRQLVNQLKHDQLAASGGGGVQVGVDFERGTRLLVPSGSKSSSNNNSINNVISSDLNAAIECKNLTYTVGLGSFQKTILHGVSLTVPEGCIYGLLGPSGCGKTTMLRCVAGRLRPKLGTIRVFGYKPNQAASQIPGQAIGYMPQEVSVYEDFTIDETLTYFGRINRMRSSLLAARIEFLLKFLNLPSKERLIKTLSGGQQRRVSLAVALVHSPPLLVLDEPTVGVDPLLRQIIWQHLVTLASSEKITIVITTHYIEEARQANIVGLMRDGRLLAENSPDELMRAFRMSSLESVFLKLCIMLDQQHQQHQHELHEQDQNDDSAPTGPEVAVASQVGVSDNTRKKKKENKTKTTKKRDKKREAQRAGDKEVTIVLFEPGYNNKALDQVDAVDSTTTTTTTATTTKQATNRRQNGSLNSTTSDLVSSSPSSAASASASSASSSSSDSDEVESLSASVGAGLEQLSRVQYKSMKPGQKYTGKPVNVTIWLAILAAITWKNFLRLRRNPPVLVFEFLLPALQLILFCLCIGGQPFDIPLAIVNEEAVPQAGKLFLNSLSKTTFKQVQFDNLSAACESVRRGHAWAAVHIPYRFTQNLNERLLHPAEVNNETLANGTISIYPDLTNLHLALTIEGAFREGFIKFTRDTLDLLGYDPQLAELPIKMAQPIYGIAATTTAATSTTTGGSGSNGYLEFMAPGVVISITYVMATGLTALAFILEKRDGLLERSQISGVTTSQILLAHALLQVFVMLFQVALVLAVTFYLFSVPSNGPFGWVVVLILLQGCTGMAFGLLISAICREENAAIMMLVGTFYINLILAGIIWPVEAMPKWLRLLSYAQPQTFPIESLRNILSRGWPISEPAVYLGFIVTIGWLLAFLIGAGLCMRYIK